MKFDRVLTCTLCSSQPSPPHTNNPSLVAQATFVLLGGGAFRETHSRPTPPLRWPASPSVVAPVRALRPIGGTRRLGRNLRGLLGGDLRRVSALSVSACRPISGLRPEPGQAEAEAEDEANTAFSWAVHP